MRTLYYFYSTLRTYATTLYFMVSMYMMGDRAPLTHIHALSRIHATHTPSVLPSTTHLQKTKQPWKLLRCLILLATATHSTGPKKNSTNERENAWGSRRCSACACKCKSILWRIFSRQQHHRNHSTTTTNEDEEEERTPPWKFIKLKTVRTCGCEKGRWILFPFGWCVAHAALHITFNTILRTRKNIGSSYAASIPLIHISS